MRHWSILVLVVAAVGFPGVPGADAPAPAPLTGTALASPAQQLSEAARRLLATVKSTSYAHHTAIDAEAGSFVTDCSGLLTWLLRQGLPEHLAVIPKARGRSHPLAEDFQEAFTAGVPGWQRIGRVTDVHPGDVLVWRYPDPQPGKSTGHVMIIDGEAVAVGAGVYALAVIDSTTAPHDDDTRSDTDGVGRGIIHVRTAADGALVAVQGKATSAFRRHIFAIARPVAR